MVKTRKEVQKINKENKDHKVKLKLQGKVKEFKKGMEPKAVIPEPGEVAAIMKEKKLASIQERLQRQRNFRFTVRDMILRRHELIEMADEISGISKLRILWEGVPCPQNILIAQHNLKKETYKNLQQAAKSYNRL